MPLANAIHLAILIAIPIVVLLYKYPRRLATRRVAGLFLWADAGRSRPVRHDEGRRSAAVLARDSVALVLLAFLACSSVVREQDMAESDPWPLVSARLIVCITIAIVLAANWRLAR